MQIEKKLGKLKFELKLSGFQIAVIATWIFFILIVPIGIDVLSKSQEPVDTSAQTLEGSNPSVNTQAGGDDIFTYTVKQDSQKELVSMLTLVFGILSAVIAVGSLVFFLKERSKREPSVFDS